MTSSHVARDSADGLHCRLFRETDLPGLLRLWETQSDWGTLTEEAWNSWYRNTPYGDCIVAVTSNDRDEIVGQLVFTPTRVRVAGREIAALRMYAPIFARSLRGTGSLTPDHPVLRMYSTGVLEGIARGVGIVYAFPTHKWLPVWRRWKGVNALMGRAFDSDFGCLAVDLTAREQVGERGRGMIASIVADLDERHSALWRRGCEEMQIACGVERSLATLRYNRGDGLSLESRNEDGKLSGYAMIRRDGLLSDFFVGTASDLAPVLYSMTRWLAAARSESQIEFDSLKIMETPQLAAAAKSIGAVRVAFDFAFVCAVVSADVPDIAIDATSWYLTPGN